MPPGLRARCRTGRLAPKGHWVPPEGAGLAGNRKRGLGLRCSLEFRQSCAGLSLGLLAWRPPQVMWTRGMDARPRSPGMGC